MSRAVLILSILLFLSSATYAYDNTLRTDFLNGKARIYAVNIRNFNAKDTNGNEIIDEGEESGNFINAIERLDEIKDLGINVLHVLPITPTGKLKALGTAGSLYAIADFGGINEQLIDKNSILKPSEQVALLVNEAHKRGIRVVFDLPSCASYDLFLRRPELFIKDEKGISIVPSDWTDVRLLNYGTNEDVNQDVFNEHKKFIDFAIKVGADGIRADVATIRPYNFWKDLIKYAREKDSEFLFLAESSDSWIESPSKYSEFTPYNELLRAGFDGYYGSFFNLKEWKPKDLYEHIKFNQKLLSSYKDKKSVILSFTTHDEVSPIVIHGENFSIMIAWLEATMPYNPYCVDGFPQGDDYIYPWANEKAQNTQTDDDTYFVHRGKIDIFNFSRKTLCKNKIVLNNFLKAYKFREDNEDFITGSEFIPLKTSNDKIFAFMRSNDNQKLIVLGNLDFQNDKSFVTIKHSGLKKAKNFDIIKGDNIKIRKNKIETDLKAGEIKVIRIKK